MSKIFRMDARAHGISKNDLRILQITDCHLGSRPNEQLLGLDTDQSLYDVLDVMQHEARPDMILVTGDISNDGGPVSYARFLKIIDGYFPNIPLAWLPGNHDDPANMMVADSYPIERQFVSDHWNMIFLDSRIPREEGGRLGSAELERLNTLLSERPDTPAAIFLHHQPVPVGCQWLDQYVVCDAPAFFDVIDTHPQVKLVSWGHVHQAFHSIRNGVSLLATPSTCVQFLPNSDDFCIDTAMPGYRSYCFSSTGSFTTSLCRVEEKAYAIDMSATGY